MIPRTLNVLAIFGAHLYYNSLSLCFWVRYGLPGRFTSTGLCCSVVRAAAHACSMSAVVYADEFSAHVFMRSRSPPEQYPLQLWCSSHFELLFSLQAGVVMQDRF